MFTPKYLVMELGTGNRELSFYDKEYLSIQDDSI